MTKPDGLGHPDEKTLTGRQMAFLPVLLASRTYTEACRKGKVGRETLYQWLRDPAFKGELDRQRAELVDQGFSLLSQSVTKAVETLVGLLDVGDARVRRLAARDVLDQAHKFKELDDLTKRIEKVEEALSQER